MSRADPAGVPAAAQAETLLGVCHAIGRVTGTPPLLARLVFVAAVLAGWSTEAVVAYLVAGLALAVARRAPVPR